MKSVTAKPDYYLLAHKVLGGNPLFAACDSATRARLIDQSRVIPLADGQVIQTRGQPVEALLLVLTGCLAVSTTSKSGKRHVIGLLQPGQISALISLIDHKPSIHDNHAHGATAVLSIDQALLRAALRTQPALNAALLDLLASRARGLHERAVSTLLDPLSVRVARTLLGLLDAYGLPRPAGILINLKLTQEEFASLLGVTRQRINRELNELERQRIIAMEYAQITVTDLTRLRRLATA